MCSDIVIVARVSGRVCWLMCFFKGRGKLILCIRSLNSLVSSAVLSLEIKHSANSISMSHPRESAHRPPQIPIFFNLSNDGGVRLAQVAVLV